MRHLIILFLFFSTISCCNQHEIMINDKSWFPYKIKSDIVYQTKNGLIDSLSLIELDSTVTESGGDCVETYENRNCKLKSSNEKDFQIQIGLSPFELYFSIDFAGKLTNLYYCTNCVKNPSSYHKINLVDSISFNNVSYHDILILSDSINSYMIYYNRNGILRYVINKDTFDLK